MTINVLLVVLSMFLSHGYACQYFQSDEFKAKAPTYQLKAAPQKCKDEVIGYANKEADLAMVDNNGGLCTNKYFITKYYCSKKCNELCPDMADRKMARVICNQFKKLDEKGATADKVGFSCKCKFIGVPGFCKVPQTTWDVVEEDYETSCLADMSMEIDNATSTAPLATTTLEAPANGMTMTRTAPTPTDAGPSDAPADVAEFTDSTTASAAALLTSASAAPAPAGAASSSDAAADTAEPTPSTAEASLESSAAPSTTTASAASTAPPVLRETFTEHMLLGETLTVMPAANHTLDTCERLCLVDHGEQCKAYQLVTTDDAATGYCWAMAQTRFDAPASFVTPEGMRAGEHSTYVGLCNGPADECGQTQAHVYEVEM